MEHWLSIALRILEADTADLRKLARIAGGNPKTFYRGTRLTDVDVTGQDIDGMEFKGGWTNQTQPFPGPTLGRDRFESHHKFTAEAEFGGQKPDMDRFYHSIQELMWSRRYAVAAGELLEAIDLFPGEPIFLKLLATVSRRLNDAELLVKTLEKAYKNFPSESWVILQYSLSLLTRDRVGEALAILKDALRASNNLSEIYELLALLARADKFEGINAYRDQLALSHGTVFYSRASVELAELYFQTLQYEEGLKTLINIVVLSPPRKARFFEVLAHAVGVPEFQDLVISVFRDAVANSGPQLPPILPFINGLAKSDLRAQALDLLNEFGRVTLSSTSVKELSQALWRLGEHRAAIKLLQRALREKPDRPYLINALIERLLELGEISEATFEARTVLQSNMKMSARLLKRFLPYCKQFPETVEILEAMSGQDPDDFGMVVVLAKAYSITGHARSALRTWSEVANAIKRGWHPPKWMLRLIVNDETAKRVPGLRDLRSKFAF
jgi:tetratricopeptide (TPR) repeat protein